MGGPRRKLLKPGAVASGAAAGRWIESFVDYLRSECHLAANTVAAYHRDLRRFYAWLGRPARAAAFDSGSGRLCRLAAPAQARAGQHRAAPGVVAHLFRYLQLEGLLTDNLAELLGSQKLWERVPHVLSPAAVERAVGKPAAGRAALAPRSGPAGAALCHRVPGVGTIEPAS